MAWYDEFADKPVASAGGGNWFDEFSSTPSVPTAPVQSVPAPMAQDILSQRAIGAGSKPAPLPTASTVPQPRGLSDTLRQTFGVLGQKVLGVKTQPTLQPQQPKSFIDMIGQAAKTGLEALTPTIGPAKKIASTPAVKGIGQGIGTLAVGMLASLNDPFGHYSTTSDKTEADLRTKAAGTAKLQPNKPINYTSDILNDAAAGIIGRLTMGKGGKVVKAAQGAGLTIFGAQVVKDTPQYVQQIMAQPDPTQKFNLATQLLGSYFLLGYGAHTTAKQIPTTKTIQGQTEHVPLDLNAAVEFTRSPNPDLTKPQIDAFTELYQKGGAEVKAAVKAGGYDLKAADVTVPTVYGTLINYVRAKIGRAEPLTPTEMKVQAAVVTQPDTLIPRAEALVKDPAALEAIRQTTPTPEAPPLRTMAQVSIPSANIQTVPHEVAVPQPSLRPQPAGSTMQVGDLMQQAAQASSPEEFIQSQAQVNPASLRGFAMSDGAIVNGPGTSPGTFSVADVKTRTIVDRPAPEVLQDFYSQARGEAAAPSPLVRGTSVPNKADTPKRSLKTARKAQAVADEAQQAINAGQPIRSLKTARTAAKISEEVMPALTAEQLAIKFDKTTAAKYDRSVVEGVAYLRKVRGDLPFELVQGKQVMDNALASYEHAKRLIKATIENGKVDIRAIGHEVNHEVWANILAPEQRLAFTEAVKEQYKGNYDEVRRTVAGYNFMDLPDSQQTVLLDGMKATAGVFPKSKSGDPFQNLVLAAETFTKGDKGAFEAKLREAAPAYSRALTRFFRDVDNQVAEGKFSDTVVEELFVDEGGKYAADRTGSMSQKLQTWFKDFWNAIKKAFGAEYDKMREIYKQSFEGKFRAELTRDRPTKPFELVRTKLKLSDDEEMWAARFREEAGKTGGEPRPIPPALGDVPIGEFRKLTDVASTPGDDHARITEAHPGASPKAVVENYDGLLELRRLKTEERIQGIFKGVSKSQDTELFKGAMDYQIDGRTTLPKELQTIFNQVTGLFQAVGQDAYVSGRIRGLQENYITQIWDTEHIPDTSLTPEQISFLKGASSVTTKFSLEKTVKSYKLGIELGLKPKYTRLSEVLRAYLQADTRAAAGRFLADDMKALGNDYVLAGANGLPPGWRPVTKLSDLKGYFVSPEAWKAIRPLDTVSGIRENKLGRAALKVNELTKQVVLAGDLFLFKNYLFDAFQASSLGPVRLLAEAADVPPEVRTNLVALGGLHLSHLNPEQANGLFGKIGRKVLSPKNPYFWADTLSFTLGDKLRIGTASMSYKKLVKKGVTPAEAAQRAVQFAQDTFGRENMVRAGHSQTVQDVMRLAMMAPDYTTARFRTMGNAVKGAIPGVSTAETRKYTYGFLRKMLVAAFAFEMVNLAMSGHTSDKNDEDHKFDLEMKRSDGSKYYVNFLGVIKTDLRFISGLADLTKGDTTTLTRFIGNKGSTIERVAQSLITGKDYRGDDIVNKYTDSTAEKIKKLGLNVFGNFVPLPIQGLTSPNVSGSGPAPRGVEGFIYRTLGFDVYDPKKMPTVVRQSLTELENEKQDVILQTYSLVKSGKTAEAAALIDAFNRKLDANGERLAKTNNISDTDRQSLQELGTSAAIDRDKQIAKAAASQTSDQPISNLIDYGVAGTTVAGNKSTTGKEIAHDNAVKAAATRKSNNAGKIKAYKPKKARVAKARKPRKLSLKSGRKPRKLSTGRVARAPRVRSLKAPRRRQV